MENVARCNGTEVAGKSGEIAFWDNIGDNWSAYWYEFGVGYTTGPLKIFGTHGVEEPAAGRGLQTFEADVGARRQPLPRLNPQTHEVMMK